MMERGVEIIAGNTMLVHIVDICTVTSAVVLFLLMIRPLMKRLPRIGMYILWFLVLVRILCPATVNGIYGLLPEKVEQSIGSIGSYMQVEGIVEKIEMRRRSTYGGSANGYRLPKEIQIRLLDEAGGRLQDFTTEVDYKGEARPFAALGVKDNTVILACGEGIYEAEPGEKKLRYILGHETDNIYYLWSELYGYVVVSVFKGDNGDYYAAMKEYREDTAIYPDESPYDPTLFLHYSQLGDTDGGGTN